MEFIHEPVLLQEVLEWMDVKPDGVYCDGTLGGGGHSGAMLRLSSGTATLYGIDRDMTAIEAATARLREFPGFHALHGNFHDGKALLMAAARPSSTACCLTSACRPPSLTAANVGSLIMRTRRWICAWTSAKGKLRRICSIPPANRSCAASSAITARRSGRRALRR